MINDRLKKLCAGLVTGLVLSAAVPAIGYDSCSTFCDPCACSDQFWVDAEYLYWQIKNSQDPVVLATEGASPSTTTPVIGGGSVENNWRSGGRFGAGYWFDETRHWGLEATYFFLPKESRSKSVTSDGALGSNYIEDPFFNVVSGLNDFHLIADPGLYSGTATRKVSNWMQGAELNAVGVMPFDCSFNFNGLIGFRYWNYDETLTFSTNSPYIDTQDIWQTVDKFNVQNNFYGGQIGAGIGYSYDCFFVNAEVKVALGAMCEELNIQSKFVTNDFNGFGAPVTYDNQGIFALPSNVGHHNKTSFACIPEVSINLGYQITDCFRVKVGYTFMYVSNMIWAGKQINSNINPSQSYVFENTDTATLVGVAQPSANITTSSLWTQGVNVGVEFQF